MHVMISVPDNILWKELKYRIKEFEENLANELKTVEEVGILKETLIKLRSKGTFKGIKYPSAWQKEVRRDRDLLCR